jgi:ribosomal protein L11 methyltransferase
VGIPQETKRKSTPSGARTGHGTLVAQLETDEQAAQRIADILSELYGADDLAVSLFDAGGGRWQVAIHFRAQIDRESLRATVAQAAGVQAASGLGFASVAETGWVRKSLAGLAPVAAGRFIVHGAHDRTRIAVNRIGIEIEAALAFGTGHHGTTRGCLLALDRICKARSKPSVAPPSPCKGAGWGGGHNARRNQTTPTRLALARRPPPFRGRKKNLRILDVGTGSGVLAIAAARALRRRVLATDIDASAVEAARGNVRLNRGGGLVDIIEANGVGARQISARAPYDLIFANILLGPLQRMATPLRRLAAPDARIILSGVLPSQANAVIASYRPLALERRTDIDGWSTLVFMRRKVHADLT